MINGKYLNFDQQLFLLSQEEISSTFSSAKQATFSSTLTLGWLPIYSDTEKSIVEHLDNLGLQQLVLVNKTSEFNSTSFSSHQRNAPQRLSSDNSLNQPKQMTSRKMSLNLADSELKARRLISTQSIARKFRAD